MRSIEVYNVLNWRCVFRWPHQTDTVRAGDYDRRTPLHLACASGNHGAVEAVCGVSRNPMGAR